MSDTTVPPVGVDDDNEPPFGPDPWLSDDEILVECSKRNPLEYFTQEELDTLAKYLVTPELAMIEWYHLFRWGAVNESEHYVQWATTRYLSMEDRWLDRIYQYQINDDWKNLWWKRWIEKNPIPEPEPRILSQEDLEFDPDYITWLSNQRNNPQPVLDEGQDLGQDLESIY